MNTAPTPDTPTYTVLSVDQASHVPLLHRHAARLGPGALGALDHFRSMVVDAGLYAVWWDGKQLTTRFAKSSRLTDGMPTRIVASPCADRTGAFPKPYAPCLYDAVRADGVASLLSVEERFTEACSAAVIAWDGAAIVVVPDETPRVASLTEAAIVRHLAPRRAPIPVTGDWPLLLTNAAIGTCAPATNRPPFPANVRATIQALLQRADA